MSCKSPTKIKFGCCKKAWSTPEKMNGFAIANSGWKEATSCGHHVHFSHSGHLAGRLAATAILSRWHLKIFSSLITPTGSLSRNSPATTFRSLNIHYSRVPRRYSRSMWVVSAATTTVSRSTKAKEKTTHASSEGVKKALEMFFFCFSADGRQTKSKASKSSTT